MEPFTKTENRTNRKHLEKEILGGYKKGWDPPDRTCRGQPRTKESSMLLLMAYALRRAADWWIDWLTLRESMLPTHCSQDDFKGVTDFTLFPTDSHSCAHGKSVYKDPYRNHVFQLFILLSLTCIRCAASIVICGIRCMEILSQRLLRKPTQSKSFVTEIHCVRPDKY